MVVRSKIGTKTASKGRLRPVEESAKMQKGAASRSVTPLDYMLSVMRNTAVDPARRDEMAKLALPYLHPKPAAVGRGGEDGEPVEAPDTSETEVARRIGFILARAALAAKQ